jgi:regulatory protein
VHSGRARSGRGGWPARGDGATAAARPERAGWAPTTPEPTTPEPAEVARDICLRLLAVRPRTRAELAAALRRGGIADRVATEVLDRYGEVGIIDDAAFARAWVESRHHGKGLARRALAGELRRKGVDDETVREAVEELAGETEVETARELVARKLRTISGGDPTSILRRLVGMLARKGYPPGVAFRVAKEALDAQGGSAAEFADTLDPDALAEAVAEAEESARTQD